MVADLREQLLARRLSPRTANVYASEIRRAERFMESRGVSLAAAAFVDVEAFVASRRRSWSTYNLARYALAHYWAIVGRADPPVHAIPPLRKPEARCLALDEGDAAALERAARARGDAAGLAVMVGLYLALRREEIATLRWDSFAGDGFCSVLGKGGRTRHLFVHPRLVEALVEARRRARGEWLFPGRFGGPVNPATVWEWTREVAATVGLVVRTHQLRHTALASMHDATGDLRATQTFAGHTRPETTAVYTRTTRRRMRQLVLSLDYGGPLDDVDVDG